MTTVKLQPAEGGMLEVDLETVKCSTTIKNLYDSLKTDNAEETIIPLPLISSSMLQMVLEWATHHKDDAPPPAPQENDENAEEEVGEEEDGEEEDGEEENGDEEEDSEEENDISAWDANFLNVDQETFFDLVSAAHYLDIKGLIDVICKSIASVIKGKSEEEVKKAFNIEGSLSLEE